MPTPHRPRRPQPPVSTAAARRGERHRGGHRDPRPSHRAHAIAAATRNRMRQSRRERRVVTTPATETPLGEPPPIDLDAATNAGQRDSADRLDQNAKRRTRATSLRLTEQARQESQTASRRGDSIPGAGTFNRLEQSLRLLLSRPRLPAGKRTTAGADVFAARRDWLCRRPTWLGETLSFEGALRAIGPDRRGGQAYPRALESSPYNLMARTGYEGSGRPCLQPDRQLARDGDSQPAMSTPRRTADAAPPPDGAAARCARRSNPRAPASGSSRRRVERRWRIALLVSAG